jgi:glycine cleavage system aminomethyltransferase T
MVLMPRPKDNKKKSNDYRGGSALLKKQQEANTKKFKAMTPAQKKAYVAKQAKAIGKTTAQVASMVGGAGLARKGGVAAARKIVPAKKVKLDESINKMKKVLSNSKGPARTTRASQPTTELERNIGRHSALRKKFPDKFKP